MLLERNLQPYPPYYCQQRENSRSRANIHWNRCFESLWWLSLKLSQLELRRKYNITSSKMFWFFNYVPPTSIILTIFPAILDIFVPMASCVSSETNLQDTEETA